MVRPASELREAAILTGWYDGPKNHYVGDGYSIPWETGYPVSPIFGGLLAKWKQYLDTRFLEPSRLHDWLYTPYGKDLIQATREEADDALFSEMIALGAPIGDANIVYRACQLGGGLYFGESTVGYIAPPLPGTGSNIRSAPTRAGRRGTVADFKVVLVFQQTTSGTSSQPTIGYTAVPRTAGWTESYWDADITREEVIGRLKGPRAVDPPIIPARAGILSSNARILGARLYEVDGGRGEFVPISAPGTAGGGDQPSASILCATTASGTPTVRRFTVRGVPDAQIIAGEFAPDYTYVSAMAAYFQSLNGTDVYGRDAPDYTQILNIDNTGLVTAKTGMGFVIGDILTVSGCVDAFGIKRGGQFLVSAVGPLSKQLTLRGWTYGPTTRGKLYMPTKSFYPIGPGDTSAVRAAQHKVGRPFAGFRGRNSRVR